MKTKSKT